jgi:hypothetical protein
MRILLAGATGVIGRQAVPVLAAAGHEVTGLARTRPGSPTPRSCPRRGHGDPGRRRAPGGPGGPECRRMTSPPWSTTGCPSWPRGSALPSPACPGLAGPPVRRRLGVAYMTGLAGAANAHARHLLDWKPTYTSWRDGLSADLDTH